MDAAKRTLALLIALTLIFTTGCGQANVQGDSDTSVEPNSTDSAEVTFDLTKYDVNVTYWATENTCYVYGGYILEIVTGGEYGENAHLRLTCIQMAPASREAEASAEIPLSEITDNKVSFSFENDGWGHSGNVTLVFLEDSIMFAVENVEYTDSSYPETWGLYENTGTLISRPTLYIDYFDSQEDYDYEDSEEQEPVYDTSKASGILASLGLTEQEFKDSCIPLDTGSINSKTTAYYVDCEALLRYPNDYVGQHFVPCNNYHDYLPCQYCDGIDDSCAYSSDFPPQRYDEKGKHWVYQSDLTTLVPESFSFYNEGLSSDGYPRYSLYIRKPYCYIFDMRDDIYSPNIAVDASVVPYLIFLGLTPAGTDLRFAMITCDVTFN